jgi:hypothetical protein
MQANGCVMRHRVSKHSAKFAVGCGACVCVRGGGEEGVPDYKISSALPLQVADGLCDDL